MKHLSIVLSLLFGALFMVSCGNEWEKFEEVDLEFSCVGADMHKADKSNSNLTYVGQVSADGGTITITPNGKNKANGFLSECYVDGQKYDAAIVQSGILAEGEWGKVEATSDDRRTTKLTVTPNKTGRTRTFVLTFGAAYTISTVSIEQPTK